MARFTLSALVALLVCLLAAPLAAEIGKGGGGGQELPLAVSDPASAFRFGDLFSMYLTDTISVPLYLDTDSAVTYIQAYFTWDTSDLAFLSVAKGPGVPETAGFQDSVISGSVHSITVLSPYNPFTIPENTPIAHVRYIVQCMGWSQSTYVSFYGGDVCNYFNAGGVSYWPLRYAGEITTKMNTYKIVWGSYPTAFPGAQNVSVHYQYYQDVPARVLWINLRFDTALVDVTDVRPGTMLPGGTVDWEVSGDTLKLDMSSFAGYQPGGDQDTLFSVDCALKTCADDYATSFTFIAGKRVDKCGTMSSLSTMGGGEIDVPNHTALADLGEMTAYPTATQYDLPFILDSNCPVDDFEFNVKYPVDTLTFAGVVAVGSFYPPLAGLDPADTSLIQINASSATGWSPEVLPATVFKLRFKRKFYMAAGTVVHVRFGTGTNEVLYDMDSPCGMSWADLTLRKGSITIVNQPPQPPSCPTLYVWNGASFEKENTILAACDGVKAPADVTDYYLVTKPAAAVDGELRFEVREDASQVSTFRDFKLVVATHRIDRPIRVTRNGTILTIGQPFSILWAKDHRGMDITPLVASKDDVCYSSEESGWFDVSLGTLAKDQLAYLGAIENPKPKENERAGGGDEGVGLDKKLHISIRTADGGWKLVSSEDARLEPTEQATLIDPSLIDAENEVVLRYSWEGWYRTDAVEFNSVELYRGMLAEPRLASAVHTRDGAVIGTTVDGMTLAPGERIALSFDVSGLPPMSSRMERSYIFVARGTYETPAASPALPAAFALGTNSPNPFNPTTVVRYRLPRASHVEIRIYDVTGALVRTLFSGPQTAGEKSVTWDGTADSGAKLASGVYFCRMSAPGFVQTRKMILTR